MNVEEILRQLKEERGRLDVAIRALGGGDGIGTHRRPGRPPGSGQKSTPAVSLTKRRTMSPAARRRIAAAMKARWAAAKKSGKKRL